MTSMTTAQLKELAAHAARGTAPTNYNLGNVNAAFAAELETLAGSVNRFQQNKHLIFEIIIENADEIVPAKVIDALGIFAEVKIVGNGQKALFKRNGRLGRQRAKKYLTQVGLSGVYETFRLDSDTYTVSAHAIGGGISIDFDRLRDGSDSLQDLMEIITTGLVDATYLEIQKALRAAVNAGAPAANRVISSSFEGDKMFALTGTVKAYGGAGTGAGGGAVIFAPPEFVNAMGADAIVPVGTNIQGIYHPQDIDAIHNQGYINLFRGTPIVQIQQSYTDETNTTTWIDPQLAYVLPTGGERVVKIVFEGPTDMWDMSNKDRSIEIMAQKKMGASIETLYNWGIYQNTGIVQTVHDPYPNL